MSVLSQEISVELFVATNVSSCIIKQVLLFILTGKGDLRKNIFLNDVLYVN